MSEKYAYATLLSSDRYIPGVLGLYYSLKYHKCKYPLVVIITDHMEISIQTIKFFEDLNIKYHIVKDLRNYYCDDRMVTPDYLEAFQSSRQNADLFQVNMMNKLYLWELKEFDKVCYFDADIIIGANIDFVFNYPTPAGKPLQLEFCNDKENMQVAGENWLICPQDFISVESMLPLVDGREGFDENILSKLYGPWNVTALRLSDESKYLFHSHVHTAKFNYWETNLELDYKNCVQEMENFINNLFQNAEDPEWPFRELIKQKAD